MSWFLSHRTSHDFLWLHRMCMWVPSPAANSSAVVTPAAGLQPSVAQYCTRHSDIPHRLGTCFPGPSCRCQFQTPGCLCASDELGVKLNSHDPASGTTSLLLWPSRRRRQGVWCIREDLMKDTDDEVDRVSSKGERGYTFLQDCVEVPPKPVLWGLHETPLHCSDCS